MAPTFAPFRTLANPAPPTFGFGTKTNSRPSATDDLDSIYTKGRAVSHAYNSLVDADSVSPGVHFAVALPYPLNYFNVHRRPCLLLLRLLRPMMAL